MEERWVIFGKEWNKTRLEDELEKLQKKPMYEKKNRESTGIRLMGDASLGKVKDCQTLQH